eukprot:COSAG06_NODE_18663_length_875_cov_0.621134_1_plen_90_part_10
MKSDGQAARAKVGVSRGHMTLGIRPYAQCQGSSSVTKECVYAACTDVPGRRPGRVVRLWCCLALAFDELAAFARAWVPFVTHHGYNLELL